ncbi:hypothetical protein M1615_02440 [Patescibacteria group bacterium]|nr:hypothetical protein [Patescibacteria group bacterium]
MNESGAEISVNAPESQNIFKKAMMHLRRAFRNEDSLNRQSAATLEDQIAVHQATIREAEERKKSLQEHNSMVNDQSQMEPTIADRRLMQENDRRIQEEQTKIDNARMAIESLRPQQTETQPEQPTSLPEEPTPIIKPVQEPAATEEPAA